MTIVNLVLNIEFRTSGKPKERFTFPQIKSNPNIKEPLPSNGIDNYTTHQAPNKVVSDVGLEPTTFSMSRRRAYQLRQSESEMVDEERIELPTHTMWRYRSSHWATHPCWNWVVLLVLPQRFPRSQRGVLLLDQRQHLNGGESAFRPRVCFTTLAFQASTFANSVISPCKLAEKVGFAPTRAINPTSLAVRRNQLDYATSPKFTPSCICHYTSSYFYHVPYSRTCMLE